MAEEENKIEKEDNKAEDLKPTDDEKKIGTKKEDSKPAISKKSSKKKKEPEIELEREYIVPLKRGVLNVPRYRRAKKAIRVLKEFMVKHMKVRDRDLRKVKIDTYLNNELWFRGIKKPANKIKVKAKKIDGIVYVELADVPEIVKFIMARDERKKSESKSVKIKKSKEVKNKEGTGKPEEKDDDKNNPNKTANAKVNTEKHIAKVEHSKKTTPVRKVLH